MQRPRTPNPPEIPGCLKIPPKIFLNPRPNKRNILIYGAVKTQKSDQFSTQKPEMQIHDRLRREDNKAFDGCRI